MKRLRLVGLSLLVTQLAACKREAPPTHNNDEVLEYVGPIVHDADVEGTPGEAAPGPGPAASLPQGHPPLPSQPSSGPARDIKPSGNVTAQHVDELNFETPSEWQANKVQNPIRLAEYAIPGPGGDGELVVFRFPGGAGGVDANLARWKSQFSPASGKTLTEVSSVKSFNVQALKISLLDISGDYGSAMGPAAPGGSPKIDQRMLAAIVEGSGDAVFFKCLGPSKTLAIWAGAFDTLLKSLRVKH